VTNRIYAANNGSSNVTVISEVQAQPNPLTTTITPLPGNTTTNAAQVFQFTASNSAVPPATNLYFQFDTFEGPWNKGTPGAVAGSFTGAASGLSVGTHILYAFAMDGEEATSVMQASSPAFGGITAICSRRRNLDKHNPYCGRESGNGSAGHVYGRCL
jgi:hypothetical protein